MPWPTSSIVSVANVPPINFSALTAGTNRLTHGCGKARLSLCAMTLPARCDLGGRLYAVAARQFARVVCVLAAALATKGTKSEPTKGTNQNVLYDLCFLWLAIIQIARDHFHHLNQHSAERLPETRRHTRVYLHSHCDSVLREVHHVRHVPREEAAVTV